MHSADSAGASYHNAHMALGRMAFKYIKALVIH